MIKRKHSNETKRKIAKDHIDEFSCYYSKGLVPMERRLRGGK